MTARAAFRQDDVTRACKGVEAAGLRVAKVVVSPTGEIEVVTGVPANDATRNPWDKELHGEGGR